MKTKFDIEFGYLAVSEGFATPEQINVCKGIVNAYREKDPRKSLDIILADRGYITYEQWTYLLKRMRIEIIVCPSCNKRFKEADINPDTVISCKYCRKKFQYKEALNQDLHQTSFFSEKTLSSLPQQTHDHFIGKSLGEKYEIIEKIATGGWSTVYKAKRTLLNMPDIVAVKILHVNLSDNPQDIKRFYNEASTLRELRHPNAIHLYDFDRDANGTIYMAMEFIRGKNLKEAIKENSPFDTTRVLTIISQVCDVISTAHKHPKKIVHRDITPQNIMLTRMGETNDFVKVLDFGIVKLWAQDNVSLTGSILGTPLYMAPEQWKGECDERTDIYSLGVVMYEMLTGKPPFVGDQITLMNKHLNEKPQPFKKANKHLKIPKCIENIVFKCLEKNRDKRPQSIDELTSLLRKAKNPGRTNYIKTRGFVMGILFLTIPLAIYLFFPPEKRTNNNTAMNSIAHPKESSINSTNNHELSNEADSVTDYKLNGYDNNKSTQYGKLPDNQNDKMPEQPIHTAENIAVNQANEKKIVKNPADKVVDNIKKYDINKKAEETKPKTHTSENKEAEIQTWLLKYKKALETGDIELLKEIGHISSEKEENKLRQNYLYVHDIKISIQNEEIKFSGNKNQVIVSFDRTDEWIDERGNRHKEGLPRITKILQKENNLWKITK